MVRVLMSYCGECIAVKGFDGESHAVSLPCRAWTCPDCAPGRSAQLIAQCHRGLPDTFLTLTLRRIPGRTPDQAALALSRAWRLLRLRIMRHRRWRKLPFAAVMEAHESGFPHLHILLRALWIDAKWLSEQMSDIADSPILKIQRIDNKAKVAGYVAKYAGKLAHKFGTAKRYWFSRDWHVVPRKPRQELCKLPGRWDREKMTLPTWVAFKTWAGWSVEYLSKRHVRAQK